MKCGSAPLLGVDRSCGRVYTPRVHRKERAVDTINIKEARRRLSDLVKAAERGRSVTITRRGKAVARLGPVPRKPRRRFPDLSAFRATIKVKGRTMTEELLAMRDEERA
jgi:prevent-host-death family protein